MHITLTTDTGGGGGARGERYSSEFSVGVCRLVLQILTLFQTKACHFSHSFPALSDTFAGTVATYPSSLNVNLHDPKYIWTCEKQH